MKNIKFLLFSVLCFISGQHLLSQNLLVLDDDPQAAPEHFATYAAAEAAAVNGDVIYVKSSGGGYGNITITKSVTLIGQGIQLNSTVKNISGVDAPESRFGSITVSADDVSLFGLHLSTSLTLNGDNVVVKGCFVGGTTSVGANTSVVLLQNNYFASSLGLTSTGINNVIISNNILQSFINGGGSDQNQFTIVHNHFLVSGTSSNALAGIQNSLVYSNVFINGLNNNIDASNVYLNNISSNGTLGSANGNQSNVMMTDVFDIPPVVGITAYDDHYFLKTGSPALSTGHDGTNVGITGGDVPSINVGNAPVPLITDLIVESIDQDNILQIQVKAEAKQ